MKQLTCFLVYVGIVLFIAACSSNSSDKNTAPQLSGMPIRLGMLDTTVFKSRDSAEKDVKYYEELCKKAFGNAATPIQFFTVRATDLLAAMGIDTLYTADAPSYKQRYVRVTIAYNQAGNQFKLYVQPVKDANLDGPDSSRTAGYALYFRRNGTIDSNSGKAGPMPKTSEPDSLYVADLNAPCPNTCRPSSIKQQ